MTTMDMNLLSRGLKSDSKKLKRTCFEQQELQLDTEISIDLLLKKVSLFTPVMENAIEEYLRQNPYANETKVIVSNLSDEALLNATCLLSDDLKEACMGVQSFVFEPGKVLAKRITPKTNLRLKI